MMVGGWTQSTMLACSAQKPSGSSIERRYMASYCSRVQWLFRSAPGGGAMVSLIDLFPDPGGDMQLPGGRRQARSVARRHDRFDSSADHLMSSTISGICA